MEGLEVKLKSMVKSSDLSTLSAVCDGIIGAPLKRIPCKAPLAVSFEGTSFLLELADIKLFRDQNLGRCEWSKNGEHFNFAKCVKCNQICGKVVRKQSSVFCENCIKSFR